MVVLISRGKISPELELLSRRERYQLVEGKPVGLRRGRAIVRMVKKS